MTQPTLAPVTYESLGDQVYRSLRELIYAQMHVLRLRSLHLPERLPLSLSEHAEIHAAVTARDPERAESVARSHVRRVLEDALGAAAARSECPGTASRR
jgi:DNA-binding GntR family transcriptional regulator